MSLLSYLRSSVLIFSSQYLNDSTLKNVHWALCTGIFGKRDVGRIEREYLEVLNFELGVSEADLLSHHQGLLDAIMYHPCPAPRFTHHNSPRPQSIGHISQDTRTGSPIASFITTAVIFTPHSIPPYMGSLVFLLVCPLTEIEGCQLFSRPYRYSHSPLLETTK